jgi:hypothetical protein
MNVPLYIGLYHGISMMSRMIRFFTWGEVVHASYIRPNGQCIEAWSPKVRKCASYHEGHTPGTVIDLYALDCTAAQANVFDMAMNMQVGKKYDWHGLFGFISRRSSAQNQEKWFCSELIQYASVRAGVEILSRIQPYKCSPQLLCYSPRLRFVGNLICQDKPYPPLLMPLDTLAAITAGNLPARRSPVNASEPGPISTHGDRGANADA